MHMRVHWLGTKPSLQAKSQSPERGDEQDFSKQVSEEEGGESTPGRQGQDLKLKAAEHQGLGPKNYRLTNIENVSC